MINPSQDRLEDSALDLIVAGTKEGVLMVESEAFQLSEDKMLEAVLLGQKTYQVVIDNIIELAKKSAKDPWKIGEKEEEIKNLPIQIDDEFGKKFITAYKIKERTY